MIGITTGIVMLLATISSSGDTGALMQGALLNAQTAADQPITLETHVREYFKDTPVLSEIAKCESQFRQFGESGKVIRGKINRKDVGIMQINEGYHYSRAKTLGYDLYDMEGNLEYAKVLYAKYGTDPWSASKNCWSKAPRQLAEK